MKQTIAHTPVRAGWFSRLRSLRPGLLGTGFLALAILSSMASAAAPTVSMMPSYSQSLTYANAAINESIQVWGRVSGGSGTYTTYDLDFGDGTSVTNVAVSNTVNPSPIPQGNRDFLMQNHTYTTGGSKTVKLTVRDNAGATAFGTSVIRVLLSPTHDERVNMAIEKGLVYLYTRQARYTPTTGGSPAGTPLVSYWYQQTGEIGNGATGATLQSFGENGHLATNDPVSDVYADTVKRGCYHLVTRGRQMTISTTVTGQNPDNGGGRDASGNPIGNGRGIYEDSAQAYSHSFVMMGIVNSFPNGVAAKNTAIPDGLWTTGQGTKPASFDDLIRDMLDQYSYSQSESSGGWHYTINTSDSSGFDGSTHQWPNISILSAKERWGITPPTWVVSRSMTCFINGTDHTNGVYDGGTGYSASNSWRNCAKTSGALVGYYLGGKLVSASDADALRSIKFISRYWGSYASYSGSDGHGWLGDFYSMFALKKGLTLQGVTTIATTNPSTGVADGVVHDWYKELSGWLLGNASLLPATGYTGPGRTLANGFGQQADGSWIGPQSYPGGYGAPVITPHAILILTKAVTVPQPVAVIVTPVPDQSSRFPAPFTLNGSTSYHQDPSIPLVEYLWDLDASDGVTFVTTADAGHAVGPTPTVDPHWTTTGSRTITLRVKDNQNPALTATTTATVNVIAADVAPTALAMPPTQVPQIYTATLGSTIVLDGSASFDVDGDVIEKYEWDLNGDGQYGTAADAALDTSGSLAKGATASVVYNSPNNSQVGLKVYSTPKNSDGVALGPQKSGVSAKPIDVYASVTDLYVSSLSVTDLVPTVRADVSVTLRSAAGSNATSAVVVRFYNGNPLAGGVQIGGSYTVNIPAGGLAGGSVVLPTIDNLALGGATTLWAFVDANNLVGEYNEANNTARVNVSNSAPVAIAQNVTVAANADCQGVVTAAQVNNGSSDPDGNSLTFTLSPAGPFELGNTAVTLTVSDGIATSTATATVTVEDKSPPVFSGCPPNILVHSSEADPTSCEQVATWTPPTAKDCTLDKVESNFKPGDSFPAGATTVTYVATDKGGLKTSCSFTVTVVDDTFPVLTVPDNILVSTDAGQCGASVAFAVSATDNCPDVTTSTNLPSGASFPKGTTTVTATAKDSAGNTVSK
ncbi:MAG: hypothetical protein JWO08_187, partial [Verrucomicrobiaceae bacterium]|nr:hypothetical protein [Verrucomicrobiaceae bacterium]